MASRSHSGGFKRESHRLPVSDLQSPQTKEPRFRECVDTVHDLASTRLSHLPVLPAKTKSKLGVIHPILTREFTSRAERKGLSAPGWPPASPVRWHVGRYENMRLIRRLHPNPATTASRRKKLEGSGTPATGTPAAGCKMS